MDDIQECIRVIPETGQFIRVDFPSFVEADLNKKGDGMNNYLLNKYPYIYGWGKLLGSQSWYIENQIDLANKENAPTDAIYRHHDGVWAVLSEVKSEATREEVTNFASFILSRFSIGDWLDSIPDDDDEEEEVSDENN